MRADAADLRVAFQHRALASHGDQFAIGRSHAIIRSNFNRAPAKEAGERDVRECDHLGCVAP
jgi:hypothetical protein